MIARKIDAPMQLEALGSIEDTTVAICRIGDEWWNPCMLLLVLSPQWH